MRPAAGSIVFVLLAGVASAPVASAQSRVPEVSVYGLVSRASTWDDEGSLGAGAGVGVGFNLNVTPSLAIELDVMRGRHERIAGEGSMRWEGTPIVGTAGVRYRFGGGRVRPYVSGGVGLLKYSGTVTQAPPLHLPPGASPGDYPTRTFSRSGTGLAMAGGVGLEIDIAQGWFVQPDARLMLTNPDNPQPLFSVTRTGISVGYRWR